MTGGCSLIRDADNGGCADQEMKLIAEILGLFRMLVRDATDKVNSTASTGKAASNSMAIEIRSHDLVSLPGCRMWQSANLTRPLRRSNRLNTSSPSPVACVNCGLWVL